jgi:histidinol dehydrogenase
MMITTRSLTAQDDIEAFADGLRSLTAVPDEVQGAVREIVEDVRARGDIALCELNERFDGVRMDPGMLEVPQAELYTSLKSLSPALRDALALAVRRIDTFACSDLRENWTIEQAPGIRVGQVTRAISPVGLYIPGGRYPYPSTVLMSGIPARAAGVEEIVFCTPPGASGRPDAVTLAACAMVGGCRVFSVGGAQAIAAMAYGTESVPACRMIAGPGNIYVAGAKRLVGDDVTVDLDAGPSEVAVFADDEDDAPLAAADLAAQLEHDPMALAVLVSDSDTVLDSVSKALGEYKNTEGAVSLIKCAGRDQCIALLNAIAPEHVEIMVDDAASVLPAIESAGAVFLGRESAVAFGDYLAGPSHVLPTGGTASRLSGLRATDFTRTMNVIAYSEEGLAGDAGSAALLAGLEGLDNHARSVKVRSRSRQGELEV